MGVVGAYVALSEIFGNRRRVQPAAATFCAFCNSPTACNTVGAVLNIRMPYFPRAAAGGTLRHRPGSNSHLTILLMECVCVNAPIAIRYYEEERRRLKFDRILTLG